MSFDLAGALQAALDDGCSLAELEDSLLAGADTDDQLAAAWLFAWAYDAIRPRPDDLAARITTRSARDRTRERRMMLDAAIDRSVIRGTLTTRSDDRRGFRGRLELKTALEAMLDPGADLAAERVPARDGGSNRGKVSKTNTTGRPTDVPARPESWSEQRAVIDDPKLPLVQGDAEHHPRGRGRDRRPPATDESLRPPGLAPAISSPRPRREQRAAQLGRPVGIGARVAPGLQARMKATAAIVGSGNVGSDLLYKLLRCEHVAPRWMIGRDPASAGLARARELGLVTSAEGVDWLLAQHELPDLVFDATCAQAHASAAPRYQAACVRTVDLTPAAVGSLVVPAVNLDAHLDAANVNMVTCGGQATVPIVHAVARVTAVRYAQIVASIASRSAGPGTRANIAQFTETTARAIEQLGGAQRGKASIILDPSDPPPPMRATAICEVDPDADRDAIAWSVREIVADVAAYVPGYRLAAQPRFDGARVNVQLEVEGAGDYLARYSGNLDIITAAAARVGEQLAQHIRGELAAIPARPRHESRIPARASTRPTAAAAN